MSTRPFSGTMMKLARAISSCTLLLLFVGCLGPTIAPEVLSREIQVFGIELHSAIDYREINGVAAEEEPCLHGYERSFVPLQITVGYSFAKRVRKIITRNPATSIFAIHPGMTMNAARPLLAQAGFSSTTLSPDLFQIGDYFLTLQRDRNDTVATLTLEIND